MKRIPAGRIGIITSVNGICRAIEAPQPGFVTLLFAITLAISSAVTGVFGQDLQPRAAVIKPPHTVVLDHHRRDVILVKFNDTLTIREQHGQLTDLGTGDLDAANHTLDQFAAGRWRRITNLPIERVDQLRANAEQTLGRQIADMNLYFHLFLPPGMSPSHAADALNALDIVELAQPVLIEPILPSPPLTTSPAHHFTTQQPGQRHLDRPATVQHPAPLGGHGVPDFEPNQGYLHDPPIGIGAYLGWANLNTRGQGIRVADIEGDFNANHLDLPPVTVLNSYDPQGLNFINHGTAVLGQIGSIDNTWGTTGASPDAPLNFAGFFIGGVLNVASAILSCVDAFDAGDIILLEVQIPGPTGNPVPVEWLLPEYNAILTAVGNGVTIVEAAGNGNQDLDASIYRQGNNGHWPFLPENNSGAIIVGAGAAPPSFGGSDVPRSRLWFSNYGSRVDVQGWGERVATTGYGSAYSEQGPNLYYTLTFAGTSSASPIVTSAAALLQARYQDCHGSPLDPLTLREALIATGTPQQSGSNPASQHIGPLPDVMAAAQWLGLIVTGDLNGDCAVDVSDLLILFDNWGLCPDCNDCPADISGDCEVDVTDLLILFDNWG